MSNKFFFNYLHTILFNDFFNVLFNGMNKFLIGNIKIQFNTRKGAYVIDIVRPDCQQLAVAYSHFAVEDPRLVFVNLNIVFEQPPVNMSLCILCNANIGSAGQDHFNFNTTFYRR